MTLKFKDWRGVEVEIRIHEGDDSTLALYNEHGTFLGLFSPTAAQLRELHHFLTLLIDHALI